jgi:hypothetical protein
MSSCPFRKSNHRYSAFVIALWVSVVLTLTFAEGCKRNRTGSVLDGTPTGETNLATVRPALPAQFYGTWEESDGQLVIDANVIKLASGNGSFSVDSDAVTVENNGSLSFIPSMDYYTGGPTVFTKVTPNVRITRRSDFELLVDTSAFRVEMGGAYLAIDAKQRTFHKQP